MEDLLVLTIYRNDKKAFNELTRLAGKYECVIDYIHISTLGFEAMLTMRITGNWSSIAKIEAALPSLAKRLEIELLSKRSSGEKTDSYFLPYKIDIMAFDQPGVMYEIIEFFSQLNVNIEYLDANSITHQQTPILRMEIGIEIPAENNIADIREQFLLFCDELNIDGTMEPFK
jgi:glycine cleavage system transcriptional repressor